MATLRFQYTVNGTKTELDVEGEIVSEHFAVAHTLLERCGPPIFCRKWTVVHRQSSNAAATYIPRKREAIRFARALEAKGDKLDINWDAKTLVGMRRRRSAYMRLRAWARRERRKIESR